MNGLPNEIFVLFHNLRLIALDVYYLTLTLCCTLYITCILTMYSILHSSRLIFCPLYCHYFNFKHFFLTLFLEKQTQKNVVDEEPSNRSSHSPESGLGSTGHLAPGHSLLAGSQFQVCNFSTACSFQTVTQACSSIVVK